MKKSMFRSLMNIRSLCATALILMTVAQVQAQVAAFTYNDGTNTAFGTLNTTQVGTDEWATSGVLNVIAGLDVGVYSLIANPNAPAPSLSPYGAFNYDDVVLCPGGVTSDPALTSNGLLFGGLNGSGQLLEINIYINTGFTNATASFGSYDGTGYNVDSQNVGQYDMQCVPEPTSMAVLGLGAVCLLRRRLKKS